MFEIGYIAYSKPRLPRKIKKLSKKYHAKLIGIKPSDLIFCRKGFNNKFEYKIK